MHYKITRRLNDVYTTRVEHYAVGDDLSWREWISKTGIQVHTHEGTIVDISPDDMAAQITDAEAMSRQLALVGVKKRITEGGQPVYELDEEPIDVSVNTDDLSLCDPELDTEQL
jgi:hypothetical protein